MFSERPRERTFVLVTLASYWKMVVLAKKNPSLSFFVLKGIFLYNHNTLSHPSTESHNITRPWGVFESTPPASTILWGWETRSPDAVGTHPESQPGHIQAQG